jgi:RND family efflux transporter MFP subunit
MHAPHLVLIVWALLGAEVPESAAKELRVESVLVTLIEQVEVPAREAGVLERIECREGQILKAGELLAQIDDADQRLLEQKARLELEIARKEAQNDVDIRLAKKTLLLARNEVRRAQESIDRFKKSVTDSELEQRRLEADRAELSQEQAEHDFELVLLTERLKENELAIAMRNLERRAIAAPIDGMVVQIKRRQGEWVEPGEPVLRMLRIDRLRVEGFVRTQDLLVDLNGRPATLSVDLPGRMGVTFDGEVVFVSPEIDPVNGQVRVWAEFENRDLLLQPGMQASLSISLPVEAAEPAANGASVRKVDASISDDDLFAPEPRP